MAQSSVPHLCNDDGVDKVYIGTKAFKCMGARPPMDHPHVYLEMGADSEIICPYCSTLFVHDARLDADQADPLSSLCSKDPDAV